jgi:hypothetical protein
MPHRMSSRTVAVVATLVAVTFAAALACMRPGHSSTASVASAGSQPKLPVLHSAVTRRPSILFASPNGAGGIDVDYLRELRRDGLEVDYTDSLDDLTRDRIQKFNVLVLFLTPDAHAVTQLAQQSSPRRVDVFNRLVDGYLADGGGVLLMPGESNVGKQQLSDLTDRWGAKLPAERIVEENPKNVGTMPHSSQGTRLAFTAEIAPSPVTEGVRGIWYPYESARLAAMTTPIVVDDKWQVVVRATATSVTDPIDFRRIDAAPGLFAREQPERRPPLMAVRDLGAGRVALIAEWRQFSIGSGTKWIFDRDVLDRGLGERRSDFGRLLSNTFRWLAEPSLEGRALGGWEAPPDGLQPSNATDATKAQYRSEPPQYDKSSLDCVPTSEGRRLYRGLIGARTAFSSGSGDVAAYARAARQAGLDFVVFLEDFERMSPEKLKTLSEECARSSDANLLLLPGYSITSNIGNHLFLFSPHPKWPPDSLLTGPRKNVIYIQEQNSKGEFTGYGTQFLSWVLSPCSSSTCQVGYYDFSDSPHGMSLRDARLYAMAGLQYYRKGHLVEDVLDDYLVAADSTIAPTPVSVNEVDSPADMTREAKSGHALTYAQASSLGASASSGIFEGALRWSHQYDSLPVFVSSGPKILSWPGLFRVVTYGAEGFAPERAVMQAPLSVASDVGLDDVRIYNGDRLFRRFALRGARSFEQVLVLDGGVQRNLVVVVRDQRGGRAVSFPRRSWADGALAPIFCSDHINDCEGWPLLAHGPWALSLSRPPVLPIDVAGETWDGGPPASISAVGSQDTWPELVAAEGSAWGGSLDPIPRLEFSDEGSVDVEARGRERYDPKLPIMNPWSTYGPVEGPAPLFENVQRYRQWVSSTDGAPATGWAATGVRTGTRPSLFTEVLSFRRAMTMRSLRLARFLPPRNATLVVGTDEERTVVDLDASTERDIVLGPGSWFAFFGSTEPMNAHLFENRGEAVRLAFGKRIVELRAEVAGRRVARGDRYTFEVSGLAFPLDKPITNDEQVARYVDYLRDPTGLHVSRGTRKQSPGLLEIAADGGAVEISLPKGDGVDGLTLPVRVLDLNPRWSAGLLQEEGYSPGFYGSGQNRFRSLGVAGDGTAYVPVYVDRAELTRVLIGHPIVADGNGGALFIQVTCLGGTPLRWHVSVNNPEDHPITTALRQAMSLPGLDFAARRLTIGAGEYLVVQ